MGVGAAVVTWGGQVAAVWQAELPGARCSESLAEVGLPWDYCCLQLALLTDYIVMICTSHAEHCCTQVVCILSRTHRTLCQLENSLSGCADLCRKALWADSKSAQLLSSPEMCKVSSSSWSRKAANGRHCSLCCGIGCAAVSQADLPSRL